MGYGEVTEIGVHNGVQPVPYDVLGVGFGPSNLALAAAIADRYRADAEDRISAVFLEQKEQFGWHRGMLIDGATMQVSFLKDLVMLRDPTSPYSFLAYLSARGRLVDFVNQKTFFPLRTEFHDYLEWVADRLDEFGRYSAQVVDMRPVRVNGVVGCVDVVAVRPGAPRQETVWRTRNVVVAPGLRPVLPNGVEPGDRVWHSADLLTAVDGLDPAAAHRFVVVGAGQSAAETAGFLHHRFPDADVHAVLNRYGYSPADNSPFANRVFDPATVDEFHRAPDGVKRRLLALHANTNYSAVDAELIDDLYRRVYREGVAGRRRLHVHGMSSVAEDIPAADGSRTVTIAHLTTGRATRVRTDHVVYATGYAPVDAADVLGAAAELCRRDDAGRLVVRRDYRVATQPDVSCGIYLQGGTEHSHGLSSSLLSNVAVRAAEILSSITRDHATGPRAGVLAGVAELGAR